MRWTLALVALGAASPAFAQSGCDRAWLQAVARTAPTTPRAAAHELAVECPHLPLALDRALRAFSAYGGPSALASLVGEDALWARLCPQGREPVEQLLHALAGGFGRNAIQERRRTLYRACMLARLGLFTEDELASGGSAAELAVALAGWFDPSALRQPALRRVARILAGLGELPLRSLGERHPEASAWPERARAPKPARLAGEGVGGVGSSAPVEMRGHVEIVVGEGDGGLEVEVGAPFELETRLVDIRGPVALGKRIARALDATLGASPCLSGLPQPVDTYLEVRVDDGAATDAKLSPPVDAATTRCLLARFGAMRLPKEPMWSKVRMRLRARSLDSPRPEARLPKVEVSFDPMRGECASPEVDRELAAERPRVAACSAKALAWDPEAGGQSGVLDFALGGNAVASRARAPFTTSERLERCVRTALARVRPPVTCRGQVLYRISR